MQVSAVLKAFIEDELCEVHDREQRNLVRRLFSGLMDGTSKSLQLLTAISDAVTSGNDASEILADFGDVPPAMKAILHRISTFTLKDKNVSYASEAVDAQAFIDRQKAMLSIDHMFRHADIADLRRAMFILLGDRSDALRSSLRHGPGLTAEGLEGVDKNLAKADADILSASYFKEIEEKWLPETTAVTRTRIRFVPKDWRRNRVIGMEPVWHMCAQLAVKSELERALLSWVPFKDQGRHRMKMCEAWDFEITTVDLSEASDRISVSLAQAICPVSWFRQLNTIRTKEYEYKGSVGTTGSFALMGNGFCFPFLSAVCLAMAFVACCRTFQMPLSRASFRYFQRRCGVSTFGDDLIIPSAARDQLRALMTYCGLSVNDAKSGNDQFLECCGLYVFKGVKPYELARLKDSGTGSQAILHQVALQNSLFARGYLRSAAEIAKQLDGLPSTTQRGLRGVALFTDSDTKMRVNRKYQRREFQGVRLKKSERPCYLADRSGVLAFITRSLKQTEVSTTTQLVYGWYPYL